MGTGIPLFIDTSSAAATSSALHQNFATRSFASGQHVHGTCQKVFLGRFKILFSSKQVFRFDFKRQGPSSGTPPRMEKRKETICERLFQSYPAPGNGICSFQFLSSKKASDSGARGAITPLYLSSRNVDISRTAYCQAQMLVLANDHQRAHQVFGGQEIIKKC